MLSANISSSFFSLTVCIHRQLNIELDDLASAMEVLTPEGSAKKILGIIQRLEEGDSGKFMDQNGNAVPF